MDRGIRCPECGRPLTAERCGGCGLLLRGPAAARLWEVDQQLAALGWERIALLGRLRAADASAGLTAAPVVGVGTAMIVPASSLPLVPLVPPVGPAAPAGPSAAAWPVANPYHRPRPEWTRRRVQNLLLALGVLLLAVAAVIFLAVNWTALGPIGRSAALIALTALSAGAATTAHRRALPATAEAVATLTLALLVIDAAGLREFTGWRTAIAGSPYAAVVAGAVVGIAVGWSRILPLRTLRYAVVGGMQLIVPLAALDSLVDAQNPGAYAAAVLTVQATAVVAARRVFRREDDRVLAIGGVVAWGGAVLTAVWTAYFAGSWFFVGPTALVVSAGLAVVTSPARGTGEPGMFGGAGDAGVADDAGTSAVAPDAAVGAGATVGASAASTTRRPFHLGAATILLFAAAATPVPHLPAPWRAPAAEALFFLAAILISTLPRSFRSGPALVTVTVASFTGLTAVHPLAQSLIAPFSTLRHVWRTPWPDARHLPVTGYATDPWSGNPQTALTLLGLVGILAISTVSVRELRAAAGNAIAPLAAGTVLLLPMSGSLVLPVATAIDLALGASALFIAVRTLRAGEPQLGPVTAGLLIVALLFLGHGVLWSLATPIVTVLAVGVLLVLAIGVGVAGPARPPYPLAAAGLGAALLALEVGLVAAYQGASISQIGVALGVTAAGYAIAALHLRRHEPPVLLGLAAGVAAVAVGLAGRETTALAVVLGLLIAVSGYAIGRPGPDDGAAVVWPPLLQILVCAETAVVAGHHHPAPAAACAAAALTVAAPWLRRPGAPAQTAAATAVTGPILYLGALLLTVGEHRADLTWPVLLAGGVAGSGATAIGHRRRQNPDILRFGAAASGVLLAASSWVWLASAHVHAVEPYTLPSAALLLAAGHLRRRHDPDAASWPSYGPGLLTGLVPPLLQALADPGLVRPGLVGLAALAVLLLGVRQRLQAPLAVGGTVLAVDAVAQLSPVLAAAYDAVPRWLLIAAAGGLLLGIGATYERRLRDLRVLTRRFTALR